MGYSYLFGFFIGHGLRAIRRARRSGVVDYPEQCQQGEHRADDAENLLLQGGQIQRNAEHRCYLLDQQQNGRYQSQPESFVFESNISVNFHK